jgi:hypothetical protein
VQGVLTAMMDLDTEANSDKVTVVSLAHSSVSVYLGVPICLTIFLPHMLTDLYRTPSLSNCANVHCDGGSGYRGQFRQGLVSSFSHSTRTEYLKMTSQPSESDQIYYLLRQCRSRSSLCLKTFCAILVSHFGEPGLCPFW